MQLNSNEQENLRGFLSSVYGPQVNNWKMNDAVFNLTIKMLSDSKKCSEIMDFVPRPVSPGQAPISFVKKTARGMLLRKLKNNKQHYKTCIKAVALVNKSKMSMAAANL